MVTINNAIYESRPRLLYASQGVLHMHWDWSPSQTITAYEIH